MQIVRCETCNGDIIPIGSVSVNLTLVKVDRCCEHCNNTHTEKQEHFFCSLPCFHDFMLKVINGEAELNWKEHIFPVFDAKDIFSKDKKKSK